MKKLLRLFIAYTLLLSSAMPASAEVARAGYEEMFFADMPAVSIASKSQESLIAASGTVYVITEEDIKRYGWRNLMEVLNSIPNMDLKYDYYWLQGGQRGFTGSFNGTLMMIDGREVQNLLAAEAYFTNYFPAHYIKRVEVLQGPNSTLYDANATQGIVNVITKFGAQGDKNLNEASITYGDAGLRSYNAVIKKVAGDNEIGFSASHHTIDNDHKELAEFVAGDGYSRDPGYLSAPFRQAKEQFRMRERDWTFDAYVRHKGFYAGVDYFLTATEGGYESVPDVPFTQNRYDRRGISLVYGGYKHTFSDTLSAMAEYQYINEYDEWIFTNVSTHTMSGFETSSLTFNPTRRPKFTSQVTWTPNDRHEIIGGFEYSKTTVGPLRSEANTIHPLDVGTNIGSTWLTDKGNSTKRSYFIQDGFKLVPDKLKLTLGARYVSQDFTNGQTLPRASAVFTPTSNSAIKLTYGKGFRPPSVFEFDGTAGTNIDSQEMEMTELNYSQNFSLGAVQFTNIAAAYHMVSTNKIDRIETPACGGGPGCFVTKVGGSQAIDGFEDQLRMNAGKWGGIASVRFISPEETKVGAEEEVIDVPLYKAKLGLSYEAMKHLTVATFIDHWGKVKADRLVVGGGATEIFEIDPWTKIDLNVRLGEFDLGDGMTSAVSLYVENVTDEEVFHANNRGADPMQFMQNPRFFRITGEVKF